MIPSFNALRLKLFVILASFFDCFPMFWRIIVWRFFSFLLLDPWFIPNNLSEPSRFLALLNTVVFWTPLDRMFKDKRIGFTIDVRVKFDCMASKSAIIHHSFWIVICFACTNSPQHFIVLTTEFITACTWLVSFIVIIMLPFTLIIIVLQLLYDWTCCSGGNTQGECG